MNKGYLSVIIVCLLGLPACSSDDYVPKPRGYFRINFPEKHYRLYDSLCPFRFEYPAYACIVPDKNERAEPCWINVEFPYFRGTLHISYKVVRKPKDLSQYFEDARSFVTKHIPKAEDIATLPVAYDSARVFGLIYDISGTGVASAYQFCVTDSLRHYLRGALYFNVIPNNDSLAPVLDFIKKDIDHLVQTLRWK